MGMAPLVVCTGGYGWNGGTERWLPRRGGVLAGAGVLSRWIWVDRRNGTVAGRNDIVMALLAS